MGMLCIFVIVVLLWCFYWNARRLCFQYKPTTALVVRKAQHLTPYRPIPKIIWSYWHAQDQPLIVQKCIDTWRRYNPDYCINVLHADTIAQFIPTDQLPGRFVSLPEFRKADWLRIALLQAHGGIWLDASIMLTQPLDWVMDLQEKNSVEFVGFYIDGYSTDKERPIIENWCMAASPQSKFIADWYAEFTTEVINQSESAYLNRLTQAGVYREVVQGIRNPTYLAMHVAASRITRHKSDYSLTLLQAEESALFYLQHVKWSRFRLFVQLALLRANTAVPSLIKFRGKDRPQFERGLQWNVFRSASVIGRYLMGAQSPHQR